MTVYRFPKVTKLVREQNIKLHLGPCKVIVTQMNRMMLVSKVFGAGMWGTFAEVMGPEYGRFQPNKTFFALPPEVAKDYLNRLELVELQGLEGVKQISKLTGNCCMCGRTLTNEASIEDGIGPICSGKMGGF